MDDILISEARSLLNLTEKKAHDELVMEFLANTGGTIDDAISIIQNNGGSIALVVESGNLSCIKELNNKGINPLLNIEDKNIAAKIKEHIAYEVTAGASSSSAPTVAALNPEEDYAVSDAAAGRPYEVSMAGSLAPESHADSDLK